MRFDDQVTINTLSGGEKTRLRVMILLALLETVETLSGISTNILIFDEALDTLDKSVKEDLKNLFAFLVNNRNKWIALVSHGSQLEDITWTGKITAEKTNGTAKITISEGEF